MTQTSIFFNTPQLSGPALNKANGKALTQSERIVEHLRHHPNRNFTNRELGAALNIPQQSMCARLTPLVQAGVIQEDEKRKCSVADFGIEATTYKIK